MECTTSSTLRRIGQGFCGTVWAAPTGSESACAFKREDGGPGRSLYNEYIMLQKVLMSASQLRVCVPVCHHYVEADNQFWWDKRVTQFPQEFQVPCNILVTDRITHLPEAVRDK